MLKQNTSSSPGSLLPERSRVLAMIMVAADPHVIATPPARFTARLTGSY